MRTHTHMYIYMYIYIYKRYDQYIHVIIFIIIIVNVYVYRSGDVQEGAGAGSSRRQLWCKLPFMCHMPQHSCVAFVAVCCIVLQCVLVYGRVLHSQAGGICGAVCLSYVTFLIHVWHLRCKLSFMYHMPHSYLTRLIYSCVTRPIHA